MVVPDALECDTCDREVDAAAARRTETSGDLDRTTWQTRCCPHCVTRLQTVSVGDQ